MNFARTLWDFDQYLLGFGEDLGRSLQVSYSSCFGEFVESHPQDSMEIHVMKLSWTLGFDLLLRLP